MGRRKLLKSEEEEVISKYFGLAAEGRSLSYRAYDNKCNPTSRNGEFERCRYLIEENVYILLIQRLWLAFYHFGFQIKPAVKLKPGAKNKFDEWHLRKYRKIDLFASQVWQDYLALDNEVTFWDKNTEPFTLAPEQCNYTDRMGLEILSFSHGLTPTEIAMLPESEREKYGKAELVLKGGQDTFKVLKRARVGEGFGKPRLKSLFRPAAAYESLEVGEVLMAFLHRAIMRWHKMGQEPKSNTGYTPNGKAAKFSPERLAEIQKNLKNKVGILEAGGNYDHSIEFIAPPIEYFKTDKWDGFAKRFWTYAGPLGFMLQAEGMHPDLGGMFMAEAELERKAVAEHLEQVIQEGFKAPCPITVEWGYECFYDPAKFLEAVQWGVSQGPVSLQKYIRRLGFSWDEMQEQKKEEAAMDEKLLKPVFDQAHGQDKAGRPKGKEDGDTNPGKR